MYNSQAVYKFANEVRTSYEKYLITIDDYAENELNDEIRYLEMTRRRYRTAPNGTGQYRVI